MLRLWFIRPYKHFFFSLFQFHFIIPFSTIMVTNPISSYSLSKRRIENEKRNHIIRITRSLYHSHFLTPARSISERKSPQTTQHQITFILQTCRQVAMSEIIKLNVGGTKYWTEKETLCKYVSSNNKISNNY